MKLGPFVLYSDFGVKPFVLRDKSGDVRAMLVERMKKGVETMKRTGCAQALLVRGASTKASPGIPDGQRRRQPPGLPGNVCRRRPRPRARAPQSQGPPGPVPDQDSRLCPRRAVDDPPLQDPRRPVSSADHRGQPSSPISRPLWSEIAAFHVGDSPGRKEPTTGEINYRNIFKWIHGKGYQGVLCLEHGLSRPGKEGERAVIEAYRACDAF